MKIIATQISNYLTRRLSKSSFPLGLLLVTLLVAPLLLVSCDPEGKPVVDVTAIIPLTGDAAPYGESIQRGMELAKAEIDADQSLVYQMNLTILDSESNADKAAQLAQQAFESSMAVIGGVTSDEAVAMVPVAVSAERVLLSPSASSPKLSGIAAGNFYRIYPSGRDEATAMSRFAAETLKQTSIVILSEDSDYGRDNAEVFQEVWEGSQEGTVTAGLTFEKANAESLSNAVAEALATDSKTVYVIALGSDLASALTTLRSAGWSGQGYRILTTSAIASPAIVELAGGAANNVYFTQTAMDLASEAEPVAGFVTAYSETYGAGPDIYAAYGRDSLHVFQTAIAEGGSGSSLLPSEFQKGMRAVKNLPGVTGSIQFRENGDVQQFVRIFYVTEDGSMVDFDKWYKNRQDEIKEKMREIQRKRDQLMKN